MIPPPFDPPKLNELTEWWTNCTYADVQRLILEVQHLRLTRWELKARVANASHRIRVLDPGMLAHGSAPRRLGYLLEKEIERANPIGRSLDVYAPFSEEWRDGRARHCAARCAHGPNRPKQARSRTRFRTSRASTGPSFAIAGVT
ncbi:hypothetical protein [Burkholderia sp. 22313]|uniref:hypothetical protein n=1 Tax=Burkholderia sp. 22313 TaxID=3453908 RepID=UPI003F868D41